MKTSLLTLLQLIISLPLLAQDSLHHRLYLLPGQGSDKRIFNHLHLDAYDTVHLAYLIPEKNETMEHYAGRILLQVDTTRDFSFIGVSLGGMISVEMAKKCHPTHIIIISSAKTASELPFKYHMMRTIPIHKLMTGRVMRTLGFVVQPIVEWDSMKERATFKSMLKEKPPLLLSRGINMIIHWKNKTYDPRVVHIHGTKDHTIPIRRVRQPVVVKKGSHMMTLTRGEEISSLVNSILQKP